MTKKKPASELKIRDWSNTPIIAVRPDGYAAGRFDNPAAAIKAGVNSGNLYQVLIGKKYTCNGFRWMAEEEYKVLWLTDKDKLKWERNPNFTYGTGKRGYRNNHKPYHSWKPGKDYTERREIARQTIKATHKRLAERRANGEFVPAGTPRKVINLDTLQEFQSITLAAQSVNRNPATLWEALQNGRKCAGYRFRFVK